MMGIWIGQGLRGLWPWTLALTLSFARYMMYESSEAFVENLVQTHGITVLWIFEGGILLPFSGCNLHKNYSEGTNIANCTKYKQ